MAFLTALTVIIAAMPVPSEWAAIGADSKIASGCDYRPADACKGESFRTRWDMIEVWQSDVLDAQSREAMLDAIKANVGNGAVNWIAAREAFRVKNAALNVNPRDLARAYSYRREPERQSVTTRCITSVGKSTVYSSCTTK